MCLNRGGIHNSYDNKQRSLWKQVPCQFWRQSDHQTSVPYSALYLQQLDLWAFSTIIIIIHWPKNEILFLVGSLCMHFLRYSPSSFNFFCLHFNWLLKMNFWRKVFWVLSVRFFPQFKLNFNSITLTVSDPGFCMDDEHWFNLKNNFQSANGCRQLPFSKTHD